MEILEEIGEVHILKGDDEKQIIKTLENAGFSLRLYEELEDENIYYILTKRQ